MGESKHMVVLAPYQTNDHNYLPADFLEDGNLHLCPPLHKHIHEQLPDNYHTYLNWHIHMVIVLAKSQTHWPSTD